MAGGIDHDKIVVLRYLLQDAPDSIGRLLDFQRQLGPAGLDDAAIGHDVHHVRFDVVQQAFVVAATKPHAIPADNIWPWFRQVVINEARNARRKHRPAPSEQENQMPDPGPNPAETAARTETSAELRQALNTLPEREREAIVLTHLNGLTHAQAADALGIPVKTLSSHVSRGMDRLKGKLGGRGH